MTRSAAGTAAALAVAGVLSFSGCGAGRTAGATTVATLSAATPPAVTSPPYPVGVTVYPVAQRRPMPALTGHTWAGAEVSTASTPGLVLVLNVWASWCEPCQAESPALARVAGQQDPLAVRFIGLDEHDTEAAATAFVRGVGSTYPHLVDDGGLLGRLSPWLPDAVPDSLVVDGQGLVAARVVGAVTEEQLRTVLNQVRTP